MLTRFQIRAEGDTAHNVEHELRWAAARLADDFGLEAELADQVIEGTPGSTFAGRITLTVTSQPTKTHSASSTKPLAPPDNPSNQLDRRGRVIA